MDNQKVRDFIKSLSMSDKNITAAQAEKYLTDALNQLDDVELNSYLKAAEKVATMTEAENSIKKSVKDLFNEIFPALSFYPAIGIWGLVDKMIQSGTISGLDTADRDKLLVYSAIFFGLVGGKIAFNRVKEKVNSIKSSDSQISEVLEAAGVEESEEDDGIDWTVRDGIEEIMSKGVSRWDAEEQYAKEHNMDWSEVSDLSQYGDEHLTLDQAKERLKAIEDEFEREQYADDYLYSNGGWESYRRQINYYKRLIKRLEDKSINESYEFKNNSSLEQAIKYVNDGMKAKYGREYPEEEDESDYRRKLCSSAAKKFNISLDKIVDKIASDYVNSMPYVIQDKQGNYSEI